MRAHRLHLSLLALSAPGLLACGGDAPERGTPAGVYWEADDTLGARECRCGWEDMRYESEAQCREGFVDGPEWIDCVEEVYPEYLDTSLGPSFQCHAEPWLRYARCLEPLSCGDSNLECLLDYQTESSGCPPVPEVDPLFSEFSGRVFACVNGER